MPNRRYLPSKKNNGIIPPVRDRRHLWVAVGCGKCIECMNQRKRQWQIRMLEEIKTRTDGKFVTLTFSSESIEALAKDAKTEEANTIAKLAVRRFLERWRKKYNVSVRHWLVTELGHTGTERLHLHGVIFTDEDIEERWQYGWVYIGEYVNEKTINYITKYVTKTDLDHPNYVPIVLCSPGIGRNYIQSSNAKNNQFKGKDTKETYRLNNGARIGLPTYYRNKLYTDEEREELWSNLLDKQERWVLGEKIDVSTIEGAIQYERALKWAQKQNRKLGYLDPKTWKKVKYLAEKKNVEKNQT